MDVNKSQGIFKVPSFAKREMYNFDDNGDFLEIYRELDEISEEIEACRLKNC